MKRLPKSLVQSSWTDWESWDFWASWAAKVAKVSRYSRISSSPALLADMGKEPTVKDMPEGLLSGKLDRKTRLNLGRFIKTMDIFFL